MSSQEYLLNNFIEKELQEVLTPLIIPEKVIVSMKFKIQDNFITSNGRLYTLLSLIVNCMLISFHIFRAAYLEMYRYQMTSFTVLICINIGTMIVEFVINYLCVLNSETIVKILLKMQEIDRSLNNIGPKRFFKYKVTTWSMVIFLVLCQSFTAFTNAYFFQDYNFINFYVTMSRFFFDVNIIYVIVLMDFMASRVNIWTSKVETLFKKENCEEDWHDKTMILLDTYRGVLQISKWLEKVFALPILFYAVELFLLSLIYVEAMLLVHLYFNVPNGTVFITLGHYFSWVVKIFVLIILLSVKCEVFYNAHRRAKSTCLCLLLKNKDDVAARRMAKNVLRACAVGFNRISACGVFTVDATLPLQLMGLAATYTVVLLQFAFL